MSTESKLINSSRFRVGTFIKHCFDMAEFLISFAMIWLTICSFLIGGVPRVLTSREAAIQSNATASLLIHFLDPLQDHLGHEPTTPDLLSLESYNTAFETTVRFSMSPESAVKLLESKQRNQYMSPAFSQIVTAAMQQCELFVDNDFTIDDTGMLRFGRIGFRLDPIKKEILSLVAIYYKTKLKIPASDGKILLCHVSHGNNSAKYCPHLSVNVSISQWPNLTKFVQHKALSLYQKDEQSTIRDVQRRADESAKYLPSNYIEPNLCTTVQVKPTRNSCFSNTENGSLSSAISVFKAWSLEDTNGKKLLTSPLNIVNVTNPKIEIICDLNATRLNGALVNLTKKGVLLPYLRLEIKTAMNNPGITYAIREDMHADSQKPEVTYVRILAARSESSGAAASYHLLYVFTTAKVSKMVRIVSTVEGQHCSMQSLCRRRYIVSTENGTLTEEVTKDLLRALKEPSLKAILLG